MKSRRLSYTPVAGGANTIATSQTPGGAGNITLDGALAVGGVIPQQELAYIVSQASVSDESGKTFTITGTNADGAPQTEDLTGANATTVVSTKFWRSISSISVSAATTGAITVGTPNTTLCAVTPTFPVDINKNYTTVAADIGGTINFTLQKAYERPTAGETPNWITLQAAGTVDVQATVTGPVGAVRAQINSYTNNATLALSILQSGK